MRERKDCKNSALSTLSGNFLVSWVTSSFSVNASSVLLYTCQQSEKEISRNYISFFQNNNHLVPKNCARILKMELTAFVVHDVVVPIYESSYQLRHLAVTATQDQNASQSLVNGGPLLRSVRKTSGGRLKTKRNSISTASAVKETACDIDAKLTETCDCTRTILHITLCTWWRRRRMDFCCVMMMYQLKALYNTAWGVAMSITWAVAVENEWCQVGKNHYKSQVSFQQETGTGTGLTAHIIITVKWKECLTKYPGAGRYRFINGFQLNLVYGWDLPWKLPLK